MVVFPWLPQSGKKATSSYVPPKASGNALAPPVQVSRKSDPRAPVPVQGTVLQANSFRVGIDQATLGSASTGNVRTWQLPTSDINRMTLGLTLTYSSAATTVSGSIQPSTAISLMTISRSDGTPVVQVSGKVLHEIYKRFSEHNNDFSETSRTVTAGKTVTATVALPLPYLRLPAAGAPYNLEFNYNSISSLGSYAANNGPTVTAATGIKTASVSTSMTVFYGATEGLETRIIQSNVPVVTGENDLAQLMSVKNQSLVDVLMYGFAADTDLDYITLIVNGEAPIPYEGRETLISKYEDAIQAARATGVFWLFPSSQIAFNANSNFQLFQSDTATTTKLGFLFYRVAPVA